jgi:RHS repeat-associated protein
VAFSADRYGATTRYFYDTAGELSCTLFPDGTVAYQASGYDTGLRYIVVEDRHMPFTPGQTGTGTRTTYDALGRLSRSERLNNLAITFTLQGEMCDTTFASASTLTRTRTDYYDDGRVWKVTQENDLTTSTDDAVTTYEYSSDLLTKTTRSPDVVDGTDTLHNQVIEAFDLNGNLLTAQSKSFKNSNSTAELFRPIAKSVYDQLNRVKYTYSCTDENDSQPAKLAQTDYDLAGKRTLETVWDSATDTDKVQTKFDYDGAGRLTKVTAGYGTPDHTITLYNYDELGNLIAQFDGNQFDATDTLVAGAKATRFEYADGLGRRTRRYLPSLAVECWDYDYLQSGDAPPAGKRMNKTQHTDFLMQRTVITCDMMGRQDLKQRWTGSAWTNLADFDYTARGQRWKMKDPFTTSIASDKYVEYQYDDLGRLQTKLVPLDATTTASLSYLYHPSGALKSISTDRGTCLSYKYDARKRLQQVFTDAAQTALAATYSYDPGGNLARIKYGNNLQSDYTYDARNHLTVLNSTRNGSAVALFNYDATGWGARRLAYSGQRRKQDESVNGTARTIEYDYDPLRRLTKENVVAGATTGAIAYDAQPGYTDPTGYGYDRAGNRRSRTVTLAGLNSRSYAAYDANDRLGASGSSAVRASFDANGNTLQVDLDANGTWDQAVADVYDVDNRLVSATRAAGTISMLYDGDGNRIKRTVGPATTYYVLDDQNPTGYAQVIEERSVSQPSAAGLVGYWPLEEGTGISTSDASGNGGTGTVNGAAWCPGALSPQALSFDGVNDYVQIGARANLVMTSALTMSAWIYPTGSGGIIMCKEGEYELGIVGGHLQWALANTNPGWSWRDTGFAPPANQWTHVATVYDQGVVRTYVSGALVHTFNGSGNIGDNIPAQNDFRIGGRQSGSQYFAGRIDQVCLCNRALSGAEVAGLAGLGAQYVYGLDLISQKRLNASSYYGYDGLGTVRYLTDGDSGAVTDTYTYDAFGNLLSTTGYTPNAYRYTGEQWDADLGMYYLRARYYHPDTGRFWTTDTFPGSPENPLSLHKYLYCQVNPVNGIDPSGDMTLADVSCAMLNVSRLAAQVGWRVYSAYDRASTVKDVAEFIYTVASTGSVNPIALAALSANFAPFGKVFKGLTVVGKKITGAAEVLANVYWKSNKSGKLLGEVGAGLAIRALKFEHVHFTPKYHGIDDIVEDSVENLIIVEAKGSAGVLTKNQMSKSWIFDKIEELRRGDSTAQAWAKKIEDAKRAGKLKGMVVTTRAEGVDAFVPDAELKNWDQIGDLIW